MIKYSLKLLVENGRRCLNDKNYFMALFLALNIPSICSRIDYSDDIYGTNNPYRNNNEDRTWKDKYCYTSWIRDHFSEADFDFLGDITAKDIYRLRCSFTHEGNISSDKIILITNETTGLCGIKMDEKMYLSIPFICNLLFRKAEIFYFQDKVIVTYTQNGDLVSCKKIPSDKIPFYVDVYDMSDPEIQHILQEADELWDNVNKVILSRKTAKEQCIYYICTELNKKECKLLAANPFVEIIRDCSFVWKGLFMEESLVPQEFKVTEYHLTGETYQTIYLPLRREIDEARKKYMEEKQSN